MLINAVLLKLDNGFKARILRAEHRSAFDMGDLLHNRNFKQIPKDHCALVTMNISAKGRRVVKNLIKVVPKADQAQLDYGLVSGAIGSPASATGGPTAATMYGRVAIKPFISLDVKEVIKTVSENVTEKITPIFEEEFFVGDEARLIYNTALGMSKEKPERAVKLMMVGPSGYGKTTLPKLFASLASKKFMRMNCATIRDPEEWFGFREARDGSTVFIRSQFAKVIEEGDVVVVLDEFNRLEPWLHNTLFPLLDDDGCTVVHDEKFSIGPGVIVVGTINVGHEFTGVFELDAALRNRFDLTLEVGPLPPLEEVRVLVKRTGVTSNDATNIVKMSNILRQNKVSCSTRSSLLVARMIKASLTIREAFETAIVKCIPHDEGEGGQRKQVVDLINTQFGPFALRKLAKDIFSPDSIVEQITSDNAEVRIVGTAILRSKGSKNLGEVSIIQILRQLDTANANVGDMLTFKEAQAIVRSLSQGATVTVDLTSMPNSSQMSNMTTIVNNAGVIISFEKVNAK